MLKKQKAETTQKISGTGFQKKKLDIDKYILTLGNLAEFLEKKAITT